MRRIRLGEHVTEASPCAVVDHKALHGKGALRSCSQRIGNGQSVAYERTTDRDGCNAARLVVRRGREVLWDVPGGQRVVAVGLTFETRVCDGRPIRAGVEIRRESRRVSDARIRSGGTRRYRIVGATATGDRYEGEHGK